MSKRSRTWNEVKYRVATGCNRTPDRYSWESRPLKKGIQTGGKKDLNNYIAPYNG